MKKKVSLLSTSLLFFSWNMMSFFSSEKKRWSHGLEWKIWKKKIIVKLHFSFLYSSVIEFQLKFLFFLEIWILFFFHIIFYYRYRIIIHNWQQRKKKSLGVSSTVFKVIIFRLCQSNIFIITTATTTKLEERYQNRQRRPVDLIHIKTK